MKDNSEEAQNLALGVGAVSGRRFSVADLDACWGDYTTERLRDILNNDYNIDDARADLISLIGSKHDPREKPPEDKNILLCRKCCKPHLLRDEDAGSDREDLRLCVRCFL